MVSVIKRVTVVACAALAAAALLPRVGVAAGPSCDPDNGGIKLPAGFCAAVVANDLGSARHVAVAPNGDLYIALMTSGGRGRPVTGGGAVALHDANGDGKYEQMEKFGSGSTTGIALRNGYVYLAHPTSVERFKLTPGQLKPGAAETIVANLPEQREHEDKGLTFDGKGGLYINIGAPSNACQTQDRRKGDKGQDPCPILEEHGGVWKFDENKPNQTLAQGTHYATGLRQFPAITWHDGAIYIVMNNRDQLDTLWPEHFNAKDNADRPAEPMYKAAKAGMNFGWPFCFYDYTQKKLLLNPEYGGDGKEVGRCSNPMFTPPIAAFPAHWAPVDVMFYTGSQFPKQYRGGAFIAFHGSWNRAPEPQAGYNVTFQPFSGGNPKGDFEVFASDFAGPNPQPGSAVARPDGVAQMPDGSLIITDSQKGKVWRVMYQGK